MKNDKNVLRRLNKQQSSRIILHGVSMTVLLFTTSRDWETVKMLPQETVCQIRINLAERQKMLNSHQVLNYSVILFILIRRSTVRRQRGVNINWHLFTA